MNTLSFIFLIGALIACSFVNAKPYEKRGQGKGMHVEGNQLLDGNNQPFVFRGINISHAWFTSKTQFSINEVAALGANSARVVLACGKQWNKTPYEEVSNIIQWCEEAGLVCVLEVHDFTGSDNPEDITVTAVEYWKEMKDLVNAHKDYVIVNIANEWESGYKSTNVWSDTYIKGVKALRDIGIENALMIDASGWGQEATPMIEHATSILSADPDKNVIFSYHVYSTLGKDYKSMVKVFDDISNTGVNWIVGEFGWYQNGGHVAYRTLMKYCSCHKIGWFAWSWSGNSGTDVDLDLTSPNTFSKNDLTNWGKEVFFGPYGIDKTSKLAYNKPRNPSSNSTPVNTYCNSCVVTDTSKDGTKWGWENGSSCKIDTSKCKNTNNNNNSGNNNSNNNSDSAYCSSCSPTSTGSDGSLWGWENNKSCKIDTNKCNGNSGNSGNSGTAPNGHPYCNSCTVTATGDDGTRWGWENEQSCVINDSKC